MHFLSIVEDNSQGIITNMFIRHFILHLDVCPFTVSFSLWPFLHVSGPKEQSFLIDANELCFTTTQITHLTLIT